MEHPIDYVRLLTSAHKDKPKFVDMVQMLTTSLVQLQGFLEDWPDLFALETAIGAQLDIVGLWLGVDRTVDVPLSDVYLTFDEAGLGFDQGVWFGRYAEGTYTMMVDDEIFRALLKAKAALNMSLGTRQETAQIMDAFLFGTGASGVEVVIEDGLDMTMVVHIIGTPPPVFLSLLTSGTKLPIRPTGVAMSYEMS